VALAEVGARHDSFLRFGGICAIVGAVLSVAAGIGFRNLTNLYPAQDVLEILAARSWISWPLTHLGFIAGALLWVFALVALSWTLIEGRSWALGRLGAAAIIVGAALHVLYSAVNGYGFTTLAQSWNDPSTDAFAVVVVGDALRRMLGGGWAATLLLFHGVPFVLYGLAVAYSPRYPSWLGWVGVVGGAGSVLTGVAHLFGKYLISLWLPVVFAIVVSAWMVAMGIMMWRHAREYEGMMEPRTPA
jgi:hypothetical protein